MTREEAIVQLNNAAGELAGDAEAAHGTADRILLDFLRAAGYADIADAYESVETACDGFWYA